MVPRFNASRLDPLSAISWDGFVSGYTIFSESQEKFNPCPPSLKKNHKGCIAGLELGFEAKSNFFEI
jgi:hypothetical protein